MQASSRKLINQTLTILIVVALGFAIYSGVQLVRSWVWLTRLQKCPMVLPADLATPGTYTASYRQSAIPPFGIVELHLDYPGATIMADDAVLAGLVFEVDVHDAENVNVYSNGFSAERATSGQITCLLDSGIVFRLNGLTIPRGDYRFDLTVVQPASALASSEQGFRAKYLISVFPFVIPTHAFIIAAATLLALILWFVRRGIRRSPDKQG